MLCEGESLSSKKPHQLFWWQMCGVAVLCHSRGGVQDQTRRGGSCPAPGAGQAGPWGGGCTGQPLPIRTRGTMQRGTGRMGTGRMGTALTGSPLLPRAPAGPSTTTVSPYTPEGERWG